MIIDASGHDSVAVKRLVDRQLVEWKGMNPMWVEDGEEHVVHKTGEVFPGLVAAGMSVTETHGLQEWDRHGLHSGKSSRGYLLIWKD